MAVRIQFRRGTAAEWASANPTLATGELGYEVDTAQIKIGNGTLAWDALSYAAVSASYVDDAIANVVGLAPETLDTLNELAASINDDPNVFDTLSNAISTAESNALAYADTVESNAASYTDTAVATSATTVEATAAAYTDSAVANLVSSAPETLDTLNELAAALGDDPNFATTISTNLGTKLAFISDTNANFLSANAVTETNTIYILVGQPGYIKIGDGVTAYGDLSFIAEAVADTIVSEHNLETQNVHGISDVADLVYQSDLTAALVVVENDFQNSISDVNNGISVIDNTINAISSSVTAVEGRVTTLENTATTLASSITATDGRVEILETTANTLTSSVDSLENTVITLESTVGSLAPLSGAELISPIISGASLTGATTLAVDATLAGVTSAELGYLSEVTSGIQGQIDSKSNVDSPSFTGTVILPVTTTIGNVVGTEISSLENVSSNIQAQLDAKLGTTSAESIYAKLDGATFTGDVVLTANTSIGTVSSEEIGYLNDVTSSIQTQLNAKAPTADPTFTGTVSGVTASMVGLGNVDNTSDADKPISNAVQTALDAKLALAGGTMTGKITLDGNPTQALHAVTKQYVDSVEAGLLTRPQVKAATTANLDSTYDNGTAGVGATLTATANGAFPLIDGVALTTVNGNRGLLVKNQTDAAENGRYNLTTQGDAETPWVLTRCSLCDEASEIPGSYTFVTDGDVNGQTGWVQYVDDPATFTVGTDDIDVFQFAGAGTITGGTNISVNGNEVSVVSNPTFANVITATSGVQFADNTIQTSAGVPSLTSFSEKTASYTLDTLDHQDNVVEMNSASAITFTIPANATLAWPVGASMDIFQMGEGQVTIANAAGVTLNFTPGNKLRTQFSSCTIMKRGTDSWVLYGDLTA
jgi:hypothetical protein